MLLDHPVIPGKEREGEEEEWSIYGPCLLKQDNRKTKYATKLPMVMCVVQYNFYTLHVREVLAIQGASVHYYYMTHHQSNNNISI